MEKDYHPGSDGQVINLVHPSLYCLVYGESTNLTGEAFNTDIEDSIDFQSAKFQWLPAEFLVAGNGKVKVDSYINNLPETSGLYLVLSELFERILPVFNRVLSSLLAHRTWNRFQLPQEYWSCFEQNYPDDPNLRNEYIGSPAYKEWSDARPVIPLPIPEFKVSKYEVPPEHMVDLKGHRLQVIVKIGSIVLTPENPEFKGGNWHVEVS